MPTVVNLDSLGSEGFLIQGDASSDFAGFSVSTAGDFNGDGYDDVIVGAPFSDLGGNAAGGAYVIFGGAAGFGTLDLSNLQAADGVRIQGDSSGDYAGFTVASAGDVNGDGFDDVLVGAPGAGYGAFSLAYVIFGEATPSASLDLSNLASSDGFVMFGDYTYSYYAALSVSGAGDVNGDGFDDVIVGSLYDNNGDGAAYVVFGKASGFGIVDLTSLSSTAGFEISGGAGSYAGRSVSGAGDINGDGFDDVIVGIPYGSEAGHAYVIFGKASGFTKVDLSNLAAGAGFIIQGAAAGDLAGWSVSAAGDVNGDGFDDIIVGSSYADNNHDLAGEAYVIFGKTGGFGTIDLSNLAPGAGFAILGDDSADHAGWSVSAAGDVNNDGFGDILIGAPFNDNTRNGSRTIDAGEAYLIYGRASGFGTIDLTNLSSQDGFVIQGEATGDWAGFAVSGAGDVDGDGYDDLIIGAPDSDLGGPSAGAAYVLFSELGINDADNDFNGDGRSDILWRHDGGAVTIWHGQANGNFTGAAFAAVPPAGWTIADTGDFNGDGRADVLWQHSTSAVTIWLGQANGSMTGSSFAATPPAGWQIMITGDFNGDGRDDVLWQHSSGTVTTWQGQANGTLAGSSLALTPPTGWSIAGMGDFNGDGRDDVLWRHSSGTITTWSGQSDGTLLGSTSGYTPLAGWSAVDTGDFNGDDRDDILWQHSTGTVTHWFGQADNTFVGSAFAQNPMPGWNIVQTGDYNGDGRDDILWQHTNGTVTGWFGQVNGPMAGVEFAHAPPSGWHVQPISSVGYWDY